jgi:lipid-binding SYLF domain-containing protein
VKKKLLAVLLCLTCTLPLFAQKKEQERLEDAAAVMKEILGMPDSIPKDVLSDAICVIVYPSVKKAALGIGASFGRGALTCRTGANYDGPWSPPAMYALEGASIGFQLGGQATDFLLLVMNERGAKSILSSKVKLGGDASIAGGPKGRTASAETDVVGRAEILSYSRSKGLFAGVSLAGSTVRSDGGANKNLYGKELSAEDIIRGGKVRATPAGQKLISILNQASPHRTKKK